MNHDYLIPKLRRRIEKVRDSLDKINAETGGWAGCFSVDYRVKEFADKSNYPLEFQIFMEEIGEIYINSSYLVLQLETPKNLVGLYGSESKITVIDDWKYDDIFFCDHKAQDVKIIGNDVDGMLYGFNITESPYTFLDTATGQERDFLEWFICFVNNRLELSMDKAFKLE